MVGANILEYQINRVVVLLSILAYLQVSCGSSKITKDIGGAPFTAQVLKKSEVSPEGRLKFKLEPATFKFMNSFNDLDGPYIKIRRGGSLKIREVNGSLVEPDSFSGGESPQLRYEVKDGVAIARDYPSLIMISAYYQFDVIFSQLEEKTGVSLESFFSAANSEKITAYFEPEISLKSNSSSTAASLKLNAAYVPGKHQFLLFQRSALENVPLAANIVVLAHEFGHALFDYSFYKNDTDQDSRFAREYAMRGINEGFADFISYVYNQVTNILQSGIDVKSLYEDRDFGKATFTFSKLDPLVNHTGTFCSGSFYCIGTLFVKSLKNAMIERKKDNFTETAFTKEIIESLMKARETMTNQASDILPIDKSQVYDEISKQEDYQYAYNGKVVGAFLNALLTGLASTTRSALCVELIKNFGETGFPTSARSGVCQ